ncbi:Rossmann-like and DUF2520 domain-containing protein [Pedobacter sp. SL55]|uniref:Rossmann-like and DUF2520 domain-containing protein n=1 Tax=Pedobacter sp. SL55 TaxID=2995161 RepID=UPI002271498E|nr:Rossmann-like and DUF2520 domain-containing protein [Pedobacter sp. SL55]WAC40647.1 DUF2520 domain-containing protein [Pedobacter sp. SL55]
MTVSIIGSGNVATHLAKALKTANVKVLSIWSNRFENAEELAQLVNAKAVKELTEIAADESDILLISVKDDAIGSVVQKLNGYSGVVAHTSGSVSLTALNGIESHGVFYPLQTFSKQKEIDFSLVPLCLEASTPSALAKLKKLAALLSRHCYDVDSEQRKILHLAAVFACNFPNYLYGIAQQLLAQNQLDFNIIKPLIIETANKIQTALPVNVQTGPAIRNDVQTLNKHEEMLQKHPEWLTIYKLLSEQIKKG